MKRCPECKKDYFDDSLLYCLDDGAALVQGSVTDEPATAIISGDRGSDESLMTAPLKMGAAATGTNSVTLRLPKFLSREQLPWILAGVLLIGLVVAVVYVRSNGGVTRPADPGRVMFHIQPPQRNAGVGQLAISPDGRTIAVAVTFEGSNHIWLRPIDSLEGRVIPGTEGAGAWPFWSPDGRSIGFMARENKVKRIDLADGTVRDLAEVSPDVRGFGGTWNRDGTILFQQGGGSGIVRVAASGGRSETLPGYEPRAEAIDRWPSFLPDGKHFIFLSTSSTADNKSEVFVGSINSPERKHLFASDSNAIYSASTDGRGGHLIFSRGGALLAQKFDADTHELIAEPFRVAERVRVNFNSRAFFSVSENGTLVYDPITDQDEGRQLTWFDRSGKAIETVGQAGAIFRFNLSPDNRFVSTSRRSTDSARDDVVVSDIARGASSRLSTFSGTGDRPVSIWSPDGKYVVWSETAEGKYRLVKKLATGAGEVEVLIESPVRVYPSDWSPDGKFILYSVVDNITKNDIWALPLEGDRKPWLYFQSPDEDRQAVFSPDGKYVAYTSRESGKDEVYVQTFPASAEKLPVSTNGGDSPRWPRKASELFYVSNDAKVMAVAVRGGNSFELGVPQPLFDIAMARSPRADDYVVSNDGQRLLFISRGTDAASSPLVVILNWSADQDR